MEAVRFISCVQLNLFRTLFTWTTLSYTWCTVSVYRFEIKGCLKCNLFGTEIEILWPSFQKKTEMGNRDHEYFTYLSGWTLPKNNAACFLYYLTKNANALRSFDHFLYSSLNRMRIVVKCTSCLSVLSHRIVVICHEIICEDFVSKLGLNL